MRPILLNQTIKCQYLEINFWWWTFLPKTPRCASIIAQPARTLRLAGPGLHFVSNIRSCSTATTQSTGHPNIHIPVLCHSHPTFRLKNGSTQFGHPDYPPLQRQHIHFGGCGARALKVNLVTERQQIRFAFFIFRLRPYLAESTVPRRSTVVKLLRAIPSSVGRPYAKLLCCNLFLVTYIFLHEPRVIDPALSSDGDKVGWCLTKRGEPEGV